MKGNREGGSQAVTYMAAAHERDDDGGDEDGGAEHHQVVLEAHEDRRDCSRARNDKRFRQSRQSKQSKRNQMVTGSCMYVCM